MFCIFVFGFNFNVPLIKMTKHLKPTLRKLENLFDELQYTVRYEKGNFNAGYCIVEDKKIVVINRFFDTDTRVNALIDILFLINMDETILSDQSKSLYRIILKKHSLSDIEI